MRRIAVTLVTGVLSTTAASDFVGFVTETTIGEPGRAAGRIFVKFDSPMDTLLVVSRIHAIQAYGSATGLGPGNFWHRDFLNGNVSTPFAGTWSPSLLSSQHAWTDSWVTIGGEPASFANTTTADPGWGAASFNQPGIPDNVDSGIAGWFNGNPPNLQGRGVMFGPMDFRVLVGNFVLDEASGVLACLRLEFNQGIGTPIQPVEGTVGFPLFENPPGDVDCDGQPDAMDNCPAVANPSQADCDGDGLGDACETDPDANLNGLPDTCETGPLVFSVPQHFASIGSAVAAATPNSIVRVGPGIYAERIDFAGKAITVESTVGSKDTILDGGGQPNPVVAFRSGEGPGSVLRGFTVRGGAGGATLPQAPELGAVGGGLLVDLASPVIEDCIIESCSAGRGGGAAVHRSAATLRRCTVRDNIASVAGGGLLLIGSSAALVDECTFTGNSAPTGGAIAAGPGQATIRDSELRGNVATGTGTALRWEYASPDASGPPSLVIEGCVIAENTSGNFGAAVSAVPVPPTLAIENTEICDNQTRNLEGPFIDLGGNILCDCPADLDGDGTVEAEDIVIVLGWWGSCPAWCPSDIDRDGSVGGTDLALVVASWGPCSD